MLGGMVVDLMDRYGCVDDLWLYRLLLDNGLDGLVNVVVDVLASNRTRDRLSVLG